jgi:hypothetical protein
MCWCRFLTRVKRNGEMELACVMKKWANFIDADGHGAPIWEVLVYTVWRSADDICTDVLREYSRCD